MTIDPIPPHLKTKMNKIAGELRSIFKPDNFTLLVFSSGANARMNYVSSAQRPGMLAAMREFIGKHEDTDPMEQVASTIPLILRDVDLPVGTEVCLKFKIPKKGDAINNMELLVWNEEDEIRDN